MSARTYLSIGDVLSLLREEFPDVTISKIRFLESQGLVDPERSPSGYRKFYERDVDRLRWVLRQQREHFLPLKVIRDRLAAAGNGVPSDDVYDDAGSSNGSGVSPTGEGETVAGRRPAEEPDDTAPGDVGAGREDTGAMTGSNVVPITVERAPSPGSHPSRIATRVAAQAAAPGAPGSSGVPPGSPPERTVPGPPPETTVPGRHAPEPPEAAPVPPAAAPPSTAAAAAAAASPPPGDSLTLDELCSSSGLTPADVASLESFGLVRPVAVAGGVYYDEDALAVAKLVVGFGRFGVEPRHLRLYRNAVDRELALVEQIVTPLLRQRNPEARRRATESTDELVHLGQGLRAALVRAELRHKLGR